MIYMSQLNVSRETIRMCERTRKSTVVNTPNILICVRVHVYVRVYPQWRSPMPIKSRPYCEPFATSAFNAADIALKYNCFR